MNVMELRGVTKDYGRGRGVFDLSLTIAQGDSLGYLGPNGAGKTTTIRQMMGFTRPGKGTVRVFGKDPFGCAEVQKRIGYLPGETAFPGDMTGDAFLRFVAGLKGVRDMKRANELRERFELDGRTRLKKMSKGTRQKVALICAFLHDPELYLLDEPTSGLDPLMQHRFAELVAEERGRGKTILLSSHLFEEIERLCGRAAILRAGRIVACEQMEKMQKSRSRIFHIVFHAEDAAEAFLRVFPAAQRQEKEIFLTVPQTDAERVLRLAVTYGVEDLTVRAQTLEELFLHYYDGGQA